MRDLASGSVRFITGIPEKKPEGLHVLMREYWSNAVCDRATMASSVIGSHSKTPKRTQETEKTREQRKREGRKRRGEDLDWRSWRRLMGL